MGAGPGLAAGGPVLSSCLGAAPGKRGARHHHDTPAPSLRQGCQSRPASPHSALHGPPCSFIRQRLVPTLDGCRPAPRVEAAAPRWGAWAGWPASGVFPALVLYVPFVCPTRAERRSCQALPPLRSLPRRSASWRTVVPQDRGPGRARPRVPSGRASAQQRLIGCGSQRQEHERSAPRKGRPGARPGRGARKAAAFPWRFSRPQGPLRR